MWALQCGYLGNNNTVNFMGFLAVINTVNGTESSVSYYNLVQKILKQQIHCPRPSPHMQTMLDKRNKGILSGQIGGEVITEIERNIKSHYFCTRLKVSRVIEQIITLRPYSDITDVFASKQESIRLEFPICGNKNFDDKSFARRYLLPKHSI
jgi:hypothetical protein